MFQERNSGQGSKRTPVVLAGGMKLHQLTMSAQDAELLSQRGFQIEEICRAFGVPPFMVGHTEKTTSWGSGVEQMSIGFVKYTLQRHLVAFEQEINHKLFKTSRNFSEFVTAGLERGDLKGRYEAYRIALGRAGEPSWMKASEIRKLENMPADDSFDNQPAATPAPTTGATQ
jgi:HK97 family phage portal protein